MLSAISQPLPLTSTHESAPVSAEPSKWLSRTTPPVVPSLMSTDSAVVSAMSLRCTTLPLLGSGWQSLIVHQLLCAVPT